MTIGPSTTESVGFKKEIFLFTFDLIFAGKSKDLANHHPLKSTKNVRTLYLNKYDDSMFSSLSNGRYIKQLMMMRIRQDLLLKEGVRLGRFTFTWKSSSVSSSDDSMSDKHSYSGSSSK